MYRQGSQSGADRPFCSIARGNAREGSDVDLLVIEDARRRFRETGHINMVLAGFGQGYSGLFD